MKGIQFDSTLIDAASEFNIVTVKSLQAAKISKQEATRSPTVIENSTYEFVDAYGHINLDVKTGDIPTQARFHIIKEHPYHDIILGRPWIHKAQSLPISVPERISNKPATMISSKPWNLEDYLLPPY